MKKVLITGAGSYIGTNFENWIKDHSDTIITETQDMQDPAWRNRDFSGFDAVFHVAGIAHADVGKATEEQKALYYRVNTDLAIECAKKAKAQGVGQFVFMSSMIVYGRQEHITGDTKPKPENFYGDSKWQADQGIRKLADDDFKVTVLRPPMIYGRNSKGNYPVLAKMAKKLPIFPKVNNLRSVLYIDNLCEFVRQVIEQERGGIFFPQNSEPMNTGRLVKEIAEVHGHRIWVSRILTPAVWVGKMIPGKIGGMCRKAFGSSYYDPIMSKYDFPYVVYTERESIELTEKSLQAAERRVY